MYQRIDDNPQMTDNEASEYYPDSYILVCRDNMYSEMGTILFIGDNMGELLSLRLLLNEQYCGIVEGLDLQRSLGGVVVGG